MKIDQTTVDEFISMVDTPVIDLKNIIKLLHSIDLTSLNKTDNDETIIDLCYQANTPYGYLAAVCVYPKFVPLVKQQLGNAPVKIASVANFPAGMSDPEVVLAEITQAIAQGANEIDVVMPYSAYLAGDYVNSIEFIKRCKNTCGPNVLLKVIIEAGALRDPILISSASYDAINAGADFIKTSTGKINTGATLESAAIILLTIKKAQHELNTVIGFKGAGGIKTLHQGLQYLKLAEIIMGEEWVSTRTFRLGASTLLLDIYDKLNHQQKQVS